MLREFKDRQFEGLEEQFERFGLWILEALLASYSTTRLRRDKLVSQLSVFGCVCTTCVKGSISTGGSQGLVYRRLETANVLHSGTVRLDRLHVLVKDGEDLVVEDLVLPNAVRHLLQWLPRKTENEKE